MLAYANPQDRSVRAERGDGYGIVRFRKANGEIVFECWPRFADVEKGNAEQYAGWPITFNVAENDGRKPIAYLKEVMLPMENAVVELTNDTTDELVYCYRVKNSRFRAPVYEKGSYTLRVGLDRGEKVVISDEIK